MLASPIHHPGISKFTEVKVIIRLKSMYLILPAELFTNPFGQLLILCFKSVEKHYIRAGTHWLYAQITDQKPH